MTFALRKPWGWGLLALGLCQGCGGDEHAPIIGDNLVRNGSFESGLDGWWDATNSEGGQASASPEAADLGAAGLKLYKGTGGWGTMVGQETEGHGAWATLQVQARVRGAVGGEQLTFSFHSQGFEVTAEDRWRTVTRLLLMTEASDNPSAIIAVTTDGATAYVDDVSFSPAQVAKGEADLTPDNQVINGSFESGLGLWTFWTNSFPGGMASTSPDAKHSGYAGMVLARGAEGTLTTVKQTLTAPVFEGEQYRIEARVRGANGGEAVNLCLQINRDPWDGPCIHEKADREWKHLSRTVTIDAAMHDERVGVLLSLGSEGSVQVDDVVVLRTRSVR
ncbi:MAG: carbohydrate binding domain-containing protein [Myxococcaceae bacterium]|nr:carbohydrate binding domain-containing protein [Myxococcaceae bacterium]